MLFKHLLIQKIQMHLLVVAKVIPWKLSTYLIELIWLHFSTTDLLFCLNVVF